MELREATESDLIFASEHTVSRGCFRERPDKIEYVSALEHEGEILMVGGIKLLNLHSAWVWMDWTEYALKYKIMCLRLVRDYLDGFMEETGVVRLMAAIEVNFPEAINTAEHLGFHREGYMPKFAGDTAAYMYVRFGKEAE